MAVQLQAGSETNFSDERQETMIEKGRIEAVIYI